MWCEKIFTHNAALLRPQILRAARQSCFHVVLVTASMLSSPSSCLHILEALHRPAARSVIFIDPDPELWKNDGLGRHLRAAHVQELIKVPRELGIHSQKSSAQWLYVGKCSKALTYKNVTRDAGGDVS